MSSSKNGVKRLKRIYQFGTIVLIGILDIFLFNFDNTLVVGIIAVIAGKLLGSFFYTFLSGIIVSKVTFTQIIDGYQYFDVECTIPMGLIFTTVGGYIPESVKIEERRLANFLHNTLTKSMLKTILTTSKPLYVEFDLNPKNTFPIVLEIWHFPEYMEQHQKVENITKPIVKILLAVLFLSCLLDMPYGYFELVRFIGVIGFIILAYLDKEKDNKTLLILWICSAVLINPFFKIALGRTIWNIVDIIWSLILLITLIIDYNAGIRKSHRSSGW